MGEDPAELARFPVWDCEVIDPLPTLSGGGKDKDDGKGGKRKGAAAKGGAKKARI
jgi:hypothetical protein